MKELLMSLVVGFMCISAVAQEKDANTLTNEGNTAYGNKDYKGAYQSYAQALDLLEKEGKVDTVLIYNAGYCAYKSDMYNEAKPYFEKSIELGYKESKPYLFLSDIYSKEDDLDKMEKVLTDGLAAYPNNKTLNKFMGICLLKEGLVFYNQGNAIKSAANESGLNQSDPEKFKAEYEKADGEFAKALPLMEKAYDYDPKSKNTLKALENIYTNLDMADKAEKVKKEMESL